MITCVHCQYSHGWTHKGGDENKWIEGDNGDFFKLRAGIFDDVEVDRFHGGNDKKLEVFGCPRCMKLFMASETYGV